jgi:hypothetical protein
VTHLDEAQFVFVGAKGFEESVDAVSGKAEDGVDAPLDKPLYDEVGYLLRHCVVAPLLGFACVRVRRERMCGSDESGG